MFIFSPPSSTGLLSIACLTRVISWEYHLASLVCFALFFYNNKWDFFLHTSRDIECRVSLSCADLFAYFFRRELRLQYFFIWFTFLPCVCCLSPELVEYISMESMLICAPAPQHNNTTWPNWLQTNHKYVAEQLSEAIFIEQRNFFFAFFIFHMIR